MIERVDEPLNHEPLTDDQALDEYLKGGSLASRRYRESAHDAVPPALDQRVLSMAREAVAKLGKSRPWMRWAAPLAVAASALIVLSIVMDQGAREHAAVSTLESDAPAVRQVPAGERSAAESLRIESLATPPPAMKTEAPAVAAPREMESAFVPPDDERADEEVQARELRKRIERESMSARRSEDLAESMPAPRADVAEIIVTGQSLQRESAPSISRTAVTTMNATQPAAAGASAPEPERWLQEIRELRAQGRNGEADREWDRFRETYPDYAVADSDLAAKKTEE